MCDERTVHEDEEFLADAANVSRRGFALLGAGALAACSTTAGAATLTEQDVTITTPDGTCYAHFVHPTRGRHAAVLVWPDIGGLRPGFRTMGRRLAESGYAVLTVNPFYRSARAPVLAEGEAFTQPDVRARLMSYTAQFNPESIARDATAYIGWLDQQAAVDTRKGVGTTGYCMGGALTMRTAAAVPSRVRAGGSFHGGGLATDAPTSPHLLIPQMRASYLVAIAQNDDAADPAAKDRLRAAFDAANRPAEIEVYPAQHGWCSIDSRVYDQVQADRAWARLLALFEANLG